MEDGVGDVTDDDRESDAEGGAPEAEGDGFDGEAKEDFGGGEPHGFAEADFAGAFLDGHEESVDDADGGGEQGDAAEDGEDDEDDVEKDFDLSDLVLDGDGDEVEFLEVFFGSLGAWVGFEIIFGGEADGGGKAGLVFWREEFDGLFE